MWKRKFKSSLGFLSLIVHVFTCLICTIWVLLKVRHILSSPAAISFHFILFHCCHAWKGPICAGGPNTDFHASCFLFIWNHEGNRLEGHETNTGQTQQTPNLEKCEGERTTEETNAHYLHKVTQPQNTWPQYYSSPTATSSGGRECDTVHTGPFQAWSFYYIHDIFYGMNTKPLFINHFAYWSDYYIL